MDPVVPLLSLSWLTLPPEQGAGSAEVLLSLTLARLSSPAFPWF